MTRVAFVTYREKPRMTADDSKMYKPLGDSGMKLFGAPWDDLTVRWQDFDVIVVRSTWDYHLRISEFLDWLRLMDEAGMPLWNPPQLITWNTEKTYLRVLAQQGIPVVPTAWLQRGQTANLPELLEQRGWAEAIIKPTISASAYKLWRVNQRQAESNSYQSRLNKMLSTNSLMVQPLIPEVVSKGEWSLIFFRHWSGDIDFSHAVLKRPARDEIRVQEEFGGIITPQQPPNHVIEGAFRALEAIQGEWLYVRVDGVDVDNRFMLMELELIEPALYLGATPQAPQRFADAIRSVLI